MNVEPIALPIAHIHTFLVHPAKGRDEASAIGGNEVPLSGPMYELMLGIYDRADTECNVTISFNNDSSGAQRNECRNLILDHARSPSLDTGRLIAKRLATHTDNRSRLGLLFLVVGKEGAEHKVIISRFPADSGILAEQNGGTLTVEFLERIFMKSAKSYKAVVYRHASLTTGFWQGAAIDKQMNDSDVNVSGYWINDFLDSDFLTTAATGTRRLALAFKHAARDTDSTDIKNQINAVVTLAPGQQGQRLSARQFVERLGISNEAKTAVLTQMKPQLVDENFQFDVQEFRRQIAYRSIELDNGGVLTAEAGKFDEIFVRESVGLDSDSVRYTTQGKVIDVKLTKA